MSKVFMNKRKTATAVIAVVLCAVIIFGGTFAWQSISQQALNEVAATRNPGGRLHDDFNDVTDDDGTHTMTFNKDVYVENFTSYAENGVQVFARVRLDEYMEFGENAGVEGNTTAKSLIDGATLDNKASWTTYIPGVDTVLNGKNPFSEYWNWAIVDDAANAEDGKVAYLPTFNKNKDSLEADINGTFDKEFTDYIEYTAGQLVKDQYEIVDKDPDDNDELARDSIDINAIITGAETLLPAYEESHVTVTQKDHTVVESQTAYVITMAQWEALPDDQKTGDFWVWDTDGWAYWANPIDPEHATGKLLDGISRKENVINEDWYYGINVVAQFITKDDIGYEEGNGFYDTEAGSVPTPKALLLLNEIGVDVTFEVDDEKELAEAVAHGGTVVLNKDMTIDTNLVVSANTTLDMNGYTITTSEGIYDNEVNDIWSLISVRGADAKLTINDGDFVALPDDCFAVDVRDGAKVVINGGNFVGNITAVYVHSGSALINGGTFSINQKNATAGEEFNQMINAYDESFDNGDAKITICGGTFYGFNPTDANDGDLVPAGYEATVDGNGIYTVSKTVAE